MKLYRIKRLSDGKFFIMGSTRINRKRKPHSDAAYTYIDCAEFNKSGAFFKMEETIHRHLYNLCCDWRDAPGYHVFGYPTVKKSGPDWDRLDLYEVDILVVLDSETIKQPAKDFMGILENA